jgi:hypothetical protein
MLLIRCVVIEREVFRDFQHYCPVDFPVDGLLVWLRRVFMRPAPPVGDAALHAFFKHFVGVYFHNGVDYWWFNGGVKDYFSQKFKLFGGEITPLVRHCLRDTFIKFCSFFPPIGRRSQLVLPTVTLVCPPFLAAYSGFKERQVFQPQAG